MSEFVDKRTESAEYWNRESQKALSEAELCRKKAIQCLVKRNYHYLYPFFEGDTVRCIRDSIFFSKGRLYFLSIDYSTGKIMATPIKKDGSFAVRSYEYVVSHSSDGLKITDYFERVYDDEG